ncbi:hypothetical protein [Fibrella aquatilis]|uniref:Uncharacterized protein n=1 Tax=Fibrella aquatilis TaxID=2817059 RepID=A0A939G7J0_9BACT|nr:hypothetical protein [Fibrella aquatilis]MBO0933316.1 hypothetical protein [Fibrella aquatilis]
MIDRLLILLFLPSICRTSAYGATDTPIERTVRITSWLIRSPFHFFSIYGIAIPMLKGPGYSILNTIFLVILIIGLWELIFRNMRLDNHIAQFFEKHRTQNQAEQLYETNPSKAILYYRFVIFFFMLWSFFWMMSFLFFVQW